MPCPAMGGSYPSPVLTSHWQMEHFQTVLELIGKRGTKQLNEVGLTMHQCYEAFLDSHFNHRACFGVGNGRWRKLGLEDPGHPTANGLPLLHLGHTCRDTEHRD